MNPVKYCILREKWRRYFDEGQRDVFDESASTIGKAQEKSPDVHVQLVNPTIDLHDLSCASASSSQKVVTSSDTAVGALPVGHGHQYPNTPNLELPQEMDQSVQYGGEGAQQCNPNLPYLKLMEQQLYCKLEKKTDVSHLPEYNYTRLYADCKNRRQIRFQTIFAHPPDFTLGANPLYIFKKGLFSSTQPTEFNVVHNHRRSKLISGKIKTKYTRKIKQNLENIMFKPIVEQSQTELKPQVEPIFNEVEIALNRQQILFEREPNLEQDSESEVSLHSLCQSQSDEDNKEEDQEESFIDADTSVVSTAGEQPQQRNYNIKLTIIICVAFFLRVLKGNILEELRNHVSYVVITLLIFVFLFLLCLCMSLNENFMYEFEATTHNGIPLDLVNEIFQDFLELAFERIQDDPEAE